MPWMRSFLVFLFPAISCISLTVVIGVVAGAGYMVELLAGVHAMFASILVAMLVAQTKQETQNPFVSPSYVMLLITVFYFYLSSFKYYVPPIYSSFVMDPLERFYGSMCAGVVIAVMILLKHYIDRAFGIVIPREYCRIRLCNIEVLWKVIVLCIPIYLVYAYCMFLVRGMEATDYVGLPYWVVVFLALGKVNQGAIIGAASLLVAACLFTPGRSVLSHPFSILLSLFVLFSSVIIAVLGQTRHVVFFAVVTFLLAIMQVRRNLGRWLIVGLFVVSPYLFVLGTGYVTRYIKDTPDRYQNVFDSISGFTYRLDLSDFAWTIYSCDGLSCGGMGMVKEAFLGCVPGAVLKNKGNQQQDVYVEQLEMAGFNSSSSLDYPDTYFSLGVLICGRFGFYLVPILILLFIMLCERIAIRVSVRYCVYPVFLIMLSFLFLRIESDLAYLSFFRSYLILLVLYLPFCMVLSFLDGSKPRLD